jgi:amino acid transporter
VGEAAVVGPQLWARIRARALAQFLCPTVGARALSTFPALASLCLGVFGDSTILAGPSSGLLVVAKAGYLPRFWQTTNEHGMATHILLVQALLVSALSVLFVVLPSVQAAYQILSQLTVILDLVMYLLMFAAGIYLRYSQPNRPRPYTIPGGDVGMWIIGGLGFVGSLLTAVLRSQQRKL